MKDQNNQELTVIKKQLTSIHKDIKLIMEGSNQQYLDLIVANLRKDYFNAINAFMTDEIEMGLEEGMVEKCQMKKTCKNRFTEFLEGNTSLIRKDEVSNGEIEERQIQLEQLRKEGPFEKCEVCFSEVSSLFGKQLNLMRSLQIYKTDQEKKQDISLISEEPMVKGILEPLSNKQRLQILKSMYAETKTFSNLSEITGLRGGNLLFHLQKLLDTNIIIQRHERGDYMITEKGFNLLILLSEFNGQLKAKEHIPSAH